MIIKTKLSPISLLAAVILFFGLFSVLSIAFSQKAIPNKNTDICLQQAGSASKSDCGASLTTYYCGIGADQVATSIDFGCRGTQCPNGQVSGHNNCHNIAPITDLLYAVIRFLSIGVGLVIVGSMIYAGIQYIGSRGEPQSTEHAMNRIRSNIIALLLFIFTYAILSFVIPPGFFN